MPKTTPIPDTFLMLTHEGLARVSIQIEAIQSIDAILAKFSSDKQMFVRNAGRTPYGPVHISSWTGASPRTWVIQELSSGVMMLSTLYETVTENDMTWVSPT